MNVVICGSLAHPDLIAAAVAAERAAGRHVIAYPVDDGLPPDEAVALWRRHIDTADTVVIVPKRDGTLGAFVRDERDYAVRAGKRVRFARVIPSVLAVAVWNE